MNSIALTPRIQVFTDGSFDPKSKVGYGAFLQLMDLDVPITTLKNLVKVKKFENTSSSKVELQSLLWALSSVLAFLKDDNASLRVYTDSQNIFGLPARRANLEKNNYCSSREKPLHLSEQYREFYRLTAQLDCEFVKIIGHQASIRKNHIDKIFGLVDQASRRALRQDPTIC